jgi:hypothetical protein
MVDAGIKAQFLDYEAALVPPARDSNRAAESVRMSTSPSPGSGIGVSRSSKLSRRGAPSGRLLRMMQRLTPSLIALSL